MKNDDSLLISVIIPVYNVDQYLRRCIESILHQTYDNLEVILINDGSTDCSGEICSELKNKDNRIIVINQRNQGVSVARNAGLEVARGELIGFVDADDFIDSDFYMLLVQGYKKSRADIVCCGVRAVREDGIEVPHIPENNIPDKECFLPIEKAFHYFFNPTHRFLYWSPWDKIIKADIAKKHRFENGRKLAEDYFYCFQCMCDCSGIYYIPDKKYNYLQRKDSVTHTKCFNYSSFDSIYFAEKASKIIEEEHCNLLLDAKLHEIVVGARKLRSMYTADTIIDFHSENFQKAYKKCRSLLKENAKNYFWNLSLRHKLLVLEALYAPKLFKAR